MNKMIKNKKGDIPVTILVIGVLAICALALASFYFYDRDVKKDFVVVGSLEEASIVKEKISVYNEMGFSQAETDQILGIKTDSQGRYIEVKQGVISVRYNLPK